jgi:hypothetical protein
MHDEENDGGFPGESPVKVPLPAEQAGGAGRPVEVAVAARFDYARMAGRPPAVPAQAGIATCRA